MSAGTLYAPKGNPFSHVVLATVAYTGVAVSLPADYVHHEHNKAPAFLARFPHGKIPAFEGADGFALFEGVVVARYLASLSQHPEYLGATAQDKALVEQWTHLTETEVDVPVQLVARLVHGHIPYSKAVHTAYFERGLRALHSLNAHLASRTFFVGERITLADVAVARSVHFAVVHALGAPERAALPHLVRHYETIVNHPLIGPAFGGQAAYAEKTPQYVPPKKEEKPKAEKPKAEKKPKAKEEEEEEEEEPLVPAEPKVKNPLDDLPKSTFNLEDWKRAYSNKETRGPGGALEWFYENFDPQGFSLWRVDFKYNAELTQTFMSSNQIGGFFNRLEGSRKYLFGSVGVLGVANASVIAGALVLRGQDARPVVDVAPDWESYAYTKLDLASAEDKKFFEAALAWDLELDGKKWVDGKNFK